VKNSLVAQLAGATATGDKQDKKSKATTDSKKDAKPKTPMPTPTIEPSKLEANCVLNTGEPLPGAIGSIKQKQVDVPAAKPAAPKQPTQKVVTSDGIKLVGRTTVIHCADCGAERTIKIQDAFQVKRCVQCQAKYVKQRRSEKLKANRAAKAAAK
jgi:hypothetical protein